MTETYAEFIKRQEDSFSQSGHLSRVDRKLPTEELQYAFAGILIYQNARNGVLSSNGILYKRPNEDVPKRRLFLHISHYMPPNLRGMTDTRENVWINYSEYNKDFVLNHELMHVLHPDWPESLVREFHESYIVDKSRFEFIRN